MPSEALCEVGSLGGHVLLGKLQFAVLIVQNLNKKHRVYKIPVDGLCFV